MNVPSGEILFHANDIANRGAVLCPEVNKEFWSYLEDGNSSSSRPEEGSLTRKIIRATAETYKLKLQHRIFHVRQAIELLKERIISEVDSAQAALKACLLQQQRNFEADAMNLILQYYAIIGQEIKASRDMLIKEKSDKHIRFAQAKILRDVRMFACHLMIESRGKISFSMLSTDSQQFSRCIKAVIDNLNTSRSIYAGISDLKQRVEVLNVFKLQNSYLSAKLQSASEKVAAGKIKGLFCCLPKDGLYSFSVFGLQAQKLPGKPVVNLKQMSEKIFSTAWFHTEPPHGMPVAPDMMQAIKVAGTASKLATIRPRSKAAAATANTSSGTSGQTEFPNNILRFSRYSSLSNLASMSELQLNNGVFLALCRVLVVKQKTVAKDIENIDIMEAIQGKYDCIYSSLREEYVLLNPRHVLPEFFMHTRLPHPSSLLSSASSSAAATVGGSGKIGASNSHNNSSGNTEADSDTATQDIKSRYERSGMLINCAPPGPLLLGSGSSAAAATATGGDDQQARQDNTKKISSPGGPEFPLEDLLLSNAVHQQQQKLQLQSQSLFLAGGATSIGPVADSQQQQQVTSRVAAMQKQGLVEQLHASIENFKAVRERELLECARSLDRSLLS